MGLDKFGGTAWGGVHNSASYWSKPNESLEEDCSICMESMNKDQTTLHCKHSFHTKVRKVLIILHCTNIGVLSNPSASNISLVRVGDCMFLTSSVFEDIMKKLGT